MAEIYRPTYTVTNPGSKPLKPVTIVDNKCVPVTFVSGDTNADGFLDPGEIWTFTCTTNIGVTTTRDVDELVRQNQAQAFNRPRCVACWQQDHRP